MRPQSLRGRLRLRRNASHAMSAASLVRARRLRAIPTAPEGLEDRTLLSNGMFAALANMLDGDLVRLQVQLSNVLDHAASVPVVGPVLGDQAPAKFLDGLRANVKSALAGLDTPSPGPTNLQIQTALFAALGNSGGLNLIADLNGNGIGTDDVVVTPATRDTTAPFDVAIHLHSDAIAASAPIAFNTGLSGLPFKVALVATGGVVVSIGYDYALAFHVGANAGNISLNPDSKLSDITQGGPAHSLVVEANATLSPNFSTTATIGFIQGTLKPVANQPNQLVGTFDLDGGNFSKVVLTGQADVNLELSGGVSSAKFPSVSTDFQLAWRLNSSDPTDGPTVRFSGVKLDLGSFLSGILGPIVQNVNQAIGPGTVVGDILTAIQTPIPGLSDLSELLGRDKVTIQSLAVLAAGDVGFGPLAQLVGKLLDVAKQITALQQSGDGSNVFIDLGGFNLTGENLQGATLGDVGDLTVANLSNLVAHPEGAIASLDQLKNDPRVPQAARDALKAFVAPSDGASVDIHIPILEDPAKAGFGLLLGQDAKLVTLDAHAHFHSKQNASTDGLSFYGVDLGFFGQVGFDADLSFGYDTFGLREILAHGAASIATDLADGFFAGTGSKIALSGRFGIQAGVNALIASIHVQGAIETGTGGGDPIGFTFTDNASHKVRFNSFADSLQVHGSLDAGLDIEISVGVDTPFGFVGYRHTFGLAEVTLLDFNPNHTKPKLALASPADANGVVTLYVGAAGAMKRSVVTPGGASVPNSGHNYGEFYTITHAGGTPGDESINVTFTVPQPDGSVVAVTQKIDHVQEIDTSDDDQGAPGYKDQGGPNGVRPGAPRFGDQALTIDVQEGVTSSVNLSGGTGKANLTYSGSGTANLKAGHGDSVLIGGPGPDILTGLEGNDTLVGGVNGADSFPGFGNNTIIVLGGLGLIGGALDTTVGIGPNGLPGVLPSPLNRVEVVAQPSRLRQTPGAVDAAGRVTTTVGTYPYLGANDLAVSVTRSDGTSPVIVFGAGITDLILDDTGDKSNFVKINDVSQTSLKTLSLDLSHPTDYGGTLHNQVTIQGAAGPDLFQTDRKSEPGSGRSVSEVWLYNDPPGTTALIQRLGIRILSLGGNDQMTLDGGGGQNHYVIHLGDADVADLMVVDANPFLAATVDGSALGPGSVAVHDIGSGTDVTFNYYDSFGAIGVKQKRAVHFTGLVDDLTVRAADGGELIFATRDLPGSKTTLLGGSGDDTFRVSGRSKYLLNGGDGSDTYLIVFGALATGITIHDTGTRGRDSLGIDDTHTALAGNAENDYEITTTGVTRVTHVVYSLETTGPNPPDGKSLNRDYTSMISFNYRDNSHSSHFSAVTLDTGAGFTSFSNSRGQQVPVPTVVKVDGTAPGTMLTINAFAGVYDADGNLGSTKYAANSVTVVRLSPESRNLDLIGGPVAVYGGGGRTTLEVFDNRDDRRLVDQVILTPTKLSRLAVSGNGPSVEVHGLDVSFANLTQVNLEASGSQTIVDSTEGNVYFSTIDLRPVYILPLRLDPIAPTPAYQIRGVATFPIDVGDDLGSLEIIQRGPLATFTVVSNPIAYPTSLVLGYHEHVIAQHVTGPLIIVGGASGEVVDIGENTVDASVYHNLNGAVSVEGNAADVTLNINDKADNGERVVTITSSAVTGLTPARISYQQGALAALNIDGPSGLSKPRRLGSFVIPPFGTTYNVLSTPNNLTNDMLVTTTIISNSLDDVNVGNKGSTRGVEGNLAIVSPNHSTYLSIDASKDGIPPSRRGRVIGMLKAAKASKTKRFIMTSAGRVAAVVAPRIRTTAPKAATTRNGQGVAPIGQVIPQLQPVIIDSNRVSGLSQGDVTYAADGLIGMTVSTPQGGKTIVVQGTPNQGALGTVRTSLIGHGLDTVYVGDSGRVSRVRGALDVANPSSYSSLIVDGSAEPAKQAVTIASGVLSGLTPASITYAINDLNGLDLRGGTGGNTFNVVGTRFRASSSIFAFPRTELPVTLDGGSGANTLIGPDTAQTWNVTGNDSGNVGKVTFSRIGSLTGGSLADTFLLSNGANLSGLIDGGAGINTLDLSSQSRNVAVDLRTGDATGIQGGVANIANVNGGRGTNVLVGDANPNILQGGSGRNLLIGGGGVDQLSGGLSGNILIGGGVTADLTLSALDSVMAEFARTDEDFLTRLTHILSGNGTNDPAYLNPSTVVNDGAASVLTGGIGANWFFAPDAFSPKGRKSGDVVTIIK